MTWRIRSAAPFTTKIPLAHLEVKHCFELVRRLSRANGMGISFGSFGECSHAHSSL
jgi:hypothetical protein